MLNIYLCDDEIEITSKAAEFIEDYFTTYSHEGECQLKIFNRGNDLLQYILETKKADVIFLDIQLEDGNGIEIARVIRRYDKKVKIVFLTNYKNYKGAAFTVRAFGYMEKPFTKKQLFRQLSDIEKYTLEEKKDILIKFETVDGLVNLSPKDILYFESCNRKVKIVTFHDSFLMAQKISVLLNIMEKYNFRCPHTSFLVNLDYIIDIKNYTISMINNIEIPLSQRKAIEFRHSLDDFLEQTLESCKGVCHV